MSFFFIKIVYRPSVSKLFTILFDNLLGEGDLKFYLQIGNIQFSNRILRLISINQRGGIIMCLLIEIVSQVSSVAKGP